MPWKSHALASRFLLGPIIALQWILLSQGQKGRGELRETMKSFVVILLCVLLCADQVHSLVCFSCERQRRNWRCLKPTKCSSEDNFCVTTVSTYGMTFLTRRRRISKRCSPTCPSFNINLGFASYSATCCQHFLCNLWGYRRWRRQ
uniref:lymphocyte antigen 6E-like n=1 Tax=Euleptes europaea TaxID=460621 RepID=UPI002541C2BA|nr:lymphocyte antigen 6E-like [Euleptes europaea]